MLKSIYSKDGFACTYLSAQLTIGNARVEYAPWAAGDNPSWCQWLIPPLAPAWPISLCMLAPFGIDQDPL